MANCNSTHRYRFAAEERRWVQTDRLAPLASQDLDEGKAGGGYEMGKTQRSALLYAGPAKGADVAAWKQAARAEHAVKHDLIFGLVLLDLVKAFERIRHAYLLRQAIKHGYPIWLLRLSLATYRLQRVVRICTSVSREVLACRGITAGSGFATSEMRLAMLSPMDAACKAHPTVVPTAFVDDVACELSGRQEAILHHLVGFVLLVCNALEDAGNEIPRKK